MTEISLESLKEFFLREQYQAQIVEETEQAPKQLVVLFGKDTQENDLFLHLTLVEERASDTTPPIYFLQFYSLFPYEIKQTALYEMARLILSINAGFDLASFGMMEGNQLFFYRYVHLCTSTHFSDEILKTLIDSITFLYETFLPSLTDIANGKKTLEELQKETKEAIRNQEFQVL